MQGVFTKFLQLWIPNKTDKGSVVTDVFEPNFTKLDQNAETTNQALSNLSSNKLDKSTYNGNAANLKIDIDTRLPKGTYPGNASDLKTEIDSNLNKIIGLEYDGSIAENKVKQVNKVYYDPNTKKLYKCNVVTNINYPDSRYFIGISNEDLLFMINSIINKFVFKPISSFPQNQIILYNTERKFSLTSDEANANEYLIVFDNDFIDSYQSKILSGVLARSSGGEFFRTNFIDQIIEFRVYDNIMQIGSKSGPSAIYISSIFYR